MRHLGSLALAIIFAPLIYILAGIGGVKLTLGMAADTNWTAVGIGVGALLVAGALYALLTMTRISPLGPILVAVLYFAIELWAVFSFSSLRDLLGDSVFGIRGAAERPLSGLALMLSVPLVLTIVSPRRWRGKEKVIVAPAAYPQTYPNQQGQPAYGQPAYGQPISGQPISGQPAPGQPAPGQPAYGQQQPGYVEPEAAAAPQYPSADTTRPMHAAPDGAADVTSQEPPVDRPYNQ